MMITIMSMKMKKTIKLRSDVDEGVQKQCLKKVL